MENTSNNEEKPWLWKKGQSGNPNGRPKGKTMKEYARDYLSSMTEEERESFLEGLPKEVIWKMAEGNPQTNTDVTTAGKPIFIPSEIAEKYGIETNTSPSNNN